MARERKGSAPGADVNVGNFTETLTRSKEARRDHNFYETDPVYTKALLRVEPLLAKPKVIWEPACGRGAISQVLEAAGHTVVSTDLVDRGYGDTGVDFLMETAAPKGVKIILTNPPYNLAPEFIRHGLSLAPTVIMLLRMAYIEGTSRSDMLDHHLARVWCGSDRPPMMHREDAPEEVKTMEDARVAFAWFVFTRKETGGLVRLRRMRWRPDGKAKKKGAPKDAPEAEPTPLLELMGS